MKLPWLPVLIFLAPGAASLNADSVAFRDGRKVEGTLLGTSARQIDFLTFEGKSIRVPIEEVASLTFSKSKPAQRRGRLSYSPQARSSVSAPSTQLTSIQLRPA